MSRLERSLKHALGHALAMILAGAIILSEIPAFATEASEEESTIEVSGSAFFEETAEVSEIDQGAPESEETESKNAVPESEETELKNTVQESETADKKESIAITKDEGITDIEKENVHTTSEPTQTEEDTSASEEETVVTTSVNASVYAAINENDNTLVKYNLEGYAASYQVTGGGLLTADDEHYYIANTEKEFLDALASAKNGTPTVIELTKDMELGNLELQKQGIKIGANASPLMHPTLMETGVSKISLQGSNLTIFSKNGSAIKHCSIGINGAKNLIIRNIVFDELWEWDEATNGEYDRNDWDYITIQRSDGIWIDHCSFYKAYDGVVDIKNPSDTSNVTVSWCRFLPGSEDDAFFQKQMDYLDAHKDEMRYYKSLLKEGLTKEQIWQYAYGQKKTSLLGQDDGATNAKGIKLTLANNYYLDSMERLPRLRYGTVHEYNCVLDSQELYDWRASSAVLKSKITSNGAISTCDGQMLLENCYIKGIEIPLVSGNAKSRPGFINAVDSLYYIGDTDKTDELVPRNNNYEADYTGSKEVLVTDPEEFRSALSYSEYTKYPAKNLMSDIVPFTGAGQLTMTTQQWEKTSYASKEEEGTEESSGEKDTYDPMEVDAEPTTFTAPAGDIVYDAEEGADNTKTKYNMEGYAASANVTGGGLLREDSPCYHRVSDELELIQTLSSLVGVQDKPHVIEITADLNLGDLELNEKYKDDKLNVTKKGDGYKNLIRATTMEPLMHPTLKKTGVSYIKLYDFHNLTIFSKNGATIKHTSIRMGGGSHNIIIRNLAFDELWEWDDVTSGDYDRNDWDYITINDNAEGIWIDHCTFHKAYDGVIDIKNLSENPIDYQRVTISWCEVLPGSRDNLFFDEQMTWLEEHIDETMYYKQLRNENKRAPNADKKMSAKDVWYLSYGQRKTHLLGNDNFNTQNKAIRVTFANNYYKNSMSRLPLLLCGKVHEYNSIFDSQELHTQHLNGTQHIVGVGAICTCRGEMLLENCYISGLRQPLKTAPGDKEGYVNAVDCLYYMNGSPAKIKIGVDGTSSPDKMPTPTDEVRFREKLPYHDYKKYDASKLHEIVLPYVGAGKLDLTTAQWERTSYNVKEGSGEDESSSAETSGTDESEGVSEEGLYIIGLKEAYDYTGAKIIPDIEVWDYDISGGKLLVLGTDYTIAYKNNLNPGTNTAEVIVTGKGNYSGKDVTKRFSIRKITDVTENLADLKGAKIDKIADVQYTGDAQYPENFTLTIKNGSPIKYIRNTDTGSKGLYKREDGEPLNINVAVSNNVNKGTATILVTGAPDAKGKPTSVKKTFKIMAADISTASVTATTAVYAVNGAVPSCVTVKYGEGEKERTLEAGKDYIIKYAKNKTAGKGTVTIIGKGNYTKKCASIPYMIEKLDLSTLKVDAVTASIGGTPGKIKAMINDGKGTALKATQYTLSVYKDKDCSESYPEDYKFETEGEPVYVVATAKEGSKDLTGSTPAAEFKVGIDISKAKIVSAATGKAVTKTYTGNAVTLTGDDLTVTLKVKGESQPRTLVIDRDYKIATYFNNINKGNAAVVIQGVNGYGGTKTVKFKITQKPIENLKKWEEMANALKDMMNNLSNS